MKILILIFGIIFGISANAAELENICKIKAKDVAQETYKSCLNEGRSAQMDKLKSEYQKKLDALKQQYEQELKKISNSQEQSPKLTPQKIKETETQEETSSPSFKKPRDNKNIVKTIVDTVQINQDMD